LNLRFPHLLQSATPSQAVTLVPLIKDVSIVSLKKSVLQEMKMDPLRHLAVSLIGINALLLVAQDIKIAIVVFLIPCVGSVPKIINAFRKMLTLEDALPTLGITVLVA